MALTTAEISRRKQLVCLYMQAMSAFGFLDDTLRIPFDKCVLKEILDKVESTIDKLTIIHNFYWPEFIKIHSCYGTNKDLMYYEMALNCAIEYPIDRYKSVHNIFFSRFYDEKDYSEIIESIKNKPILNKEYFEIIDLSKIAGILDDENELTYALNDITMLDVDELKLISFYRHINYSDYIYDEITWDGYEYLKNLIEEGCETIKYQQLSLREYTDKIEQLRHSLGVDVVASEFNLILFLIGLFVKKSCIKYMDVIKQMSAIYDLCHGLINSISNSSQMLEPDSERIYKNEMKGWALTLVKNESQDNKLCFCILNPNHDIKRNSCIELPQSVDETLLRLHGVSEDFISLGGKQKL